MKKVSMLALFALGVLVLGQAMSATYACHKEATLISTGDGDMIIEVGELIHWEMMIYIANVGQFGMDTWDNVVVKDNLAADLTIDFASLDTHGTGSASYTVHGGSNQVRILWNGFSLPYGEDATLTFDVYTDLNPAGKQEYTSPYWHTLNSGPTLKCFVDGVQYSLTMDSIEVYVYP